MSGQNALNMKQPPIQSTAGAVPIRNEKGNINNPKLAIASSNLADDANSVAHNDNSLGNSS